jgi:hypothetical protein
MQFKILRIEPFSVADIESMETQNNLVGPAFSMRRGAVDDADSGVV